MRVAGRVYARSLQWRISRLASFCLQVGLANSSYARTAALMIVGIQAFLVVLTAITKIMLNADGAYFVYVIGAGDPWGMKWSALPVRFSAYLATVVPTMIISRIWQLSGEQIAIVNGLAFYGLQLVQFVAIVVLGRKKQAHLLFFPVMQYAVGGALGFGFPSEISIAPGFFWICMFCLAQERIPLFVFVPSFLALAFCHELALPACMLVLVWLYKRQQQTTKLRPPLYASFCILICWLAIRFGTTSEADSAAIHVIDPRRFLNSPTLFLVATISTSLIAVRIPQLRIVHMLLFVVALFIPLLLAPSMDFGQGRYEAARNFTALGMLAFGACFFAAASSFNVFPQRADDQLLVRKAALVVTAALAIGLGSSLAFLRDWTIGLAAFDRYTGKGHIETPILAFTLAEAQLEFNQAEIAAIKRSGFSWTWAYRSVVLAPNFRPQRILYDPETVFCEHRPVAQEADGYIMLTTRRELTDFLCATQRARPPTLSQRLLARIRSPFRALGHSLHSKPLAN